MSSPSPAEIVSSPPPPESSSASAAPVITFGSAPPAQSIVPLEPPRLSGVVTVALPTTTRPVSPPVTVLPVPIVTALASVSS